MHGFGDYFILNSLSSVNTFDEDSRKQTISLRISPDSPCEYDYDVRCVTVKFHFFTHMYTVMKLNPEHE